MAFLAYASEGAQFHYLDVLFKRCLFFKTSFFDHLVNQRFINSLQQTHGNKFKFLMVNFADGKQLYGRGSGTSTFLFHQTFSIPGTPLSRGGFVLVVSPSYGVPSKVLKKFRIFKLVPMDVRLIQAAVDKFQLYIAQAGVPNATPASLFEACPIVEEPAAIEKALAIKEGSTSMGGASVAIEEEPSTVIEEFEEFSKVARLFHGPPHRQPTLEEADISSQLIFCPDAPSIPQSSIPSQPSEIRDKCEVRDSGEVLLPPGPPISEASVHELVFVLLKCRSGISAHLFWPAVIKSERFYLISRVREEPNSQGRFSWDCRSKVVPSLVASTKRRVNPLAYVTASDALSEDGRFLGCAWLTEGYPEEAYALPGDKQYLNDSDDIEIISDTSEFPRHPQVDAELLKIADASHRTLIRKQFWKQQQCSKKYLYFERFIFPTADEVVASFGTWFDVNLPVYLQNSQNIPVDEVKAHITNSFSAVPNGYAQYFVVFNSDDEIAPAWVGDRVIIEKITEHLYGPINFSWLILNGRMIPPACVKIIPGQDENRVRTMLSRCSSESFSTTNLSASLKLRSAVLTSRNSKKTRSLQKRKKRGFKSTKGRSK